MRIISGSHRGKRINAPKNLPSRPTTDMAKEALFNILRNYYDLSDCHVLDLYAGTGNISYEFASRGAPRITAVDMNPKCADFIAKTSKALDFPIEVIKSAALPFLNKTGAKFDIVFADPPYNFHDDEFTQFISVIFDRGLLKNDGVLIVEHSKFTDLSGLDYFSESRRYGGSVFSIFRPQES